MAVGSDMVVPEGKFIQGELEVLRFKQNPVGNGLESSEKPFNTSIFHIEDMSL